MRKFTLLLICACVICLSIGQVQAQDLSLNGIVQNTLSSGSQDTFAFTAREGQLLSFVARSEDGLDTMLSLLDLNGDVVLSNDDYDYPDSLDAIIEGFVAPYSGSYSLIVEGYGNTSGAYTLEMISGYSSVVVQDNFDNGTNWEAVSTDLINSPTLNVVNGTANLFQSGIDIMGLGIGVPIDSDVYFARASIDSISDNTGWRAGLIFGYQDELNFHRVVVNYRGAWRMAAIRNGEEITLRDWNVHPAIMPDSRTFSLSVLVNGTSFDVFYNDQYVGSSIDSNFSNGQVGLVAESMDAIGSEVTVRYNDLIVTMPMQASSDFIFPENIVANGINGSIRELEQRLLIPTGGTMAFTLSESFAQNNREGVSRFPIGDGRTITNFAMGTRVSWASGASSLNGCGLVIRDDSSENFVLAYVDSTGGFGLSERSGSEFIQNYYNTRTPIIRPPVDMVLIVRDDTVHYYVNGQHAASMDIGIREGVIAEAVVNFEAVNTNCQFNNLWVWQW